MSETTTPGTEGASKAQLPRPALTLADAAGVLREHYGLTGIISELGSQQDRNFLIDTAPEMPVAEKDEGEPTRFVLKISNMEYDASELEAQNAALAHIAAQDAAPAVPVVRPAVDGSTIVPVTVGEKQYRARLLTFMKGEQLTARHYLAPATVAQLGTLSAQVGKALTEFRHEGLGRRSQWDLRNAGPVMVELLQALGDQDLKNRIATAVIGAFRKLKPLEDNLRLQAIHGDITDDNIVARRTGNGRFEPCGVIDFGDAMESWLVSELAVTCASILHHNDGDPFAILPAVRAWQAIMPLNREELTALWPLIVIRAAVLVAASETQLSIEPDNRYVAGNIEHERRIFEAAQSVPASLMEIALMDAAGMPIDATPPGIGPLLPDIDPGLFRMANLDVTDEAFHDGNWRDREIDWKLLARAARDTGVSTTRYGEYRLSRAVENSLRESDSLALHIDICAPAGTLAITPFTGTLYHDAESRRIRLVGSGVTLHIEGLACEVEDGTELGASQPFGRIEGAEGAAGGLRVRLCRDPAIEPPLFCPPSQAAIWTVLCPDPSALTGIETRPQTTDAAELLARRKAALASPQKNYYSAPPQIERGRAEHLYTTHGRALLDMVNNVTIAGHGHPRIVAAAARQWSMLNTNSRFHYAAIAEFSERLAALAPEGLDKVFLVNSGSEAVDLALRLAWAHTGKRNIVSLLEAYHGWTVASDAVSTSIADNPAALETRPPWVHAVTAPNTFRGPFRGNQTTSDYVALVASTLRDIDSSGEGLAGFISEAVYGNAGGIPLPDGYLQQVYAQVRERGGVTIADEVQVGYGRLGHHFWGFGQQGVTPDIITIAKGMGNGQPLGAVITSAEIAASLEKEGYFFSSAGGSPVSCAVGMAVLDIMSDESLPENARIVGDALKEQLEELAQRFPLIGAVHGMGLYLGVEFVRDRESLEPATGETEAICERLLDLGVIMQPTGDHLNVLKIKPPLCLAAESAAFFIEALEKVLSEGW